MQSSAARNPHVINSRQHKNAKHGSEPDSRFFRSGHRAAGTFHRSFLANRDSRLDSRPSYRHWLALVIIVFLYQPVKVEGTSMAPLLSDQERIFINKFVYRFEPIQRRDVVVFWYPLDRSKSFIKRVIALPGESVEIRQGIVYVNGHAIQEPYVPPQYEDLSDFGPIRVPKDSYFVMGDHRISSNDS